MRTFRINWLAYLVVLAAVGVVVAVLAGQAAASGGGGTGAGGGSVQVKVDTIKVTKAFTNATATTGGQMLIKAASSDPAATLLAYRPDGSLIGAVQNGGGSRYGGTVMPYQPYDPVWITIRSSSGGSVTVPTGPFVL